MKRSFVNETPFFHGAKASSFRFARNLRRNQTSSEEILWHQLKSRKLSGFKFRRQHPFQKVIFDFYCHEAKLAIEVDGEYHKAEARTIERDKERDKIMESLSIRTLRFTNQQVLNSLPKVIKTIQNNLPSPAGEGSGVR
ncbi:MAG: endonuclease domain-containing protein [Bacteroidota bacterium]|nr:endonuclease domain-containing protein [Bacteroidota bacterium]